MIQARCFTILFACVCAVVVAGCRDGDAGGAAQTGKTNVVLVVIDTLRVDKLGCYGNELGLTPRIDQFASQGVRFANAYSHAPWTLPAFASLLTSTYPQQHQAGGSLGRFTMLSKKVETLGQRFQTAGYATHAITNVDFLTSTFGMDRGFDTLDFQANDANERSRNAEQTTDAAVRWIDKHKARPFFIMVHYFDPHLLYDPPKAYREKYADPQDRGGDDAIFGTVKEVIDLRHGIESVTPEQVHRLEQLYNGEIAYTDHQVGRLLDEIVRMNLDGRTLIVLTADHGEEFLDHGGFEHGHTLYNELIHVPLAFRLPGTIAPAQVQAVVRHIDVAPTVCAIAGVPPSAQFLGRNLLEVIRAADQAAGAPVLAQGNFWGSNRLALIENDYKVIHDPSVNGFQLFQISVDPREQTNLAGEHLDRCRAMVQAIDRLLARAQSQEAPPTPQVSDEQLNRLKSFGYASPVGGGLEDEPAPATQPGDETP